MVDLVDYVSGCYLFCKSLSTPKLIVCCRRPFLGKICYHCIKQADDEQIKNKVDERIAYRVRAFVDIDKCVNGIGKCQGEYQPPGYGYRVINNSFADKPV
jgi:hypothetical protein